MDVEIKNIFNSGLVHSNLSSAGLIGIVIRNLSLPYEGDNISNNYYDTTTSSLGQCVGQYLDYDPVTDISSNKSIPSGFCHPINTDGSQPNYFKNNSTNPPLNQWNFSTIWKTNCTNYPDFVGSTILDPMNRIPGVRGMVTIAQPTP